MLSLNGWIDGLTLLWLFIFGFSFGLFFIYKCSEALSTMENACWVCNTPFNDSKPSKPYDSELKEKITVEESEKSKYESELKK